MEFSFYCGDWHNEDTEFDSWEAAENYALGIAHENGKACKFGEAGQGFSIKSQPECIAYPDGDVWSAV